MAVGLVSSRAKLRPLIVAVTPPVVGALPLPMTFQEITGADEATISRCSAHAWIENKTVKGENGETRP